MITHLPQINRKVDLVVLESSRKWRALPPSFCSVDGIFGFVGQFGIIWVAVVTSLTLESTVTSDLIKFYRIHTETMVLLMLSYQLAPTSLQYSSFWPEGIPSPHVAEASIWRSNEAS